MMNRQPLVPGQHGAQPVQEREVANGDDDGHRRDHPAGERVDTRLGIVIASRSASGFDSAVTVRAPGRRAESGATVWRASPRTESTGVFGSVTEATFHRRTIEGWSTVDRGRCCRCLLRRRLGLPVVGEVTEP
jgi:hypothetical protein